MKGFGDLYKSKKKVDKKNKLSNKKKINRAIEFHVQGNIAEAAKYYEKLINQGCNDERVFSNYGAILQGLNKLEEAAKYYLHAIELNPDFANAHNNLGVILRDLGNFKNAELSTRKAIELNPNYADAHYNLGNILSDLGKLHEGELAYRNAIKLNPDYADAHYNLGNILRDLGKLKDAELSYLKAIELNPKLAEAYSNLGNILKNLGKLKESFDAYIKAIELNSISSNIYSSISRFLKESDISQLNKSKLKNILNILLERNDIPHKELFSAFNYLYGDKIISHLEKVDSDFSKIELLINEKIIINALKKITFKDFRLEKVLTNLRKYICHRIAESKEEISECQIQFILALGEQCFLNEYVYSLTKEEKLSINKIIKKCLDGQLNEKNISILACYYPLHKLLDQIPSLKSFNSSNQSCKEIMILQISEPLQEAELSKNIKQLGAINDDISQKVKYQYEENPYPRWRYGSHAKNQRLSINQSINIEINPNYIYKNEGREQLNVLIAGCGTGNQILQSQRYKNAQITAIDLSLSSLSYAQRKINELGINNVELIEMDILDVNLLEKQFDIIECGGVLHHMKDPTKGLRALLNVLKNKCFLKLGLYSELARQPIVEARKYIDAKKLQPKDEDIKDFREDVFSGKVEKIINLKNFSNFYTMSECRDLCFHTQEHRFTINQLQETLKSNELEFLGFLLPKSIKSLYEQFFPENREQTNLQNWEIFEKKYPKTFLGMYQFWVCKG